MKIDDMREGFIAPSPSLRSVPFWSWNDKLEIDELVRQIGEMKAQGMGGFFMHSREGLETAYMGEGWLACIEACVREAKRLGLQAWLYDEDRFPSGGAGGTVAAKGDAYRAKAVTLEAIGKADAGAVADKSAIAVFLAKVDGTELLRWERIAADGRTVALGEGELLLVFRREISEPDEWFNDEAPADNLNPASVAAFIESTYEPYRRTVGDEFGQAVPGIFTDEPNIADFRSPHGTDRAWLPWTDGFAAFFRERRGYDLLDEIPLLFFQGERAPKIRHDYWRTITERFGDAYSRQLGAWCEAHGIALTGHYLVEHNLGIGTRLNGAVMPQYRYQQVPGIDILEERTEEYWTVKQCTSVANQYGKRRVLSEMYGCAGWEFTFEGQKWVGDWQYVMGVNARCQHLALYSLKGCRKRDFPPAFGYNTPWWKYNHAVEDYFARIAAVTTQGPAVRDVLVLHPSSTVWTMVGCDPYRYLGWDDPSLQAANRLERQCDGVVRALLGSHYDFDFGDETIMAETASAAEGTLAVGLASYKVVVLPGVASIWRSTAELLLAFLEGGGRVIVVEPVPTMIEGERSGELAALLSHPNAETVGRPRDAVRALEAALPRRVSICDRAGSEASSFLYLMTELEDGYGLFIVNNDRNSGHEVEIALERPGKLEEWDLLGGCIAVRGTSRSGKSGSGGGMRFTADFGPAGSRMFVVRTGEPPLEAESDFSYVPVHERNRVAEATLGPACRFTRTSPNALVLDRCHYRFDGGAWSEPMLVWEAQRAIRETLGMRPVHYNGIPQRYRWIGEPHPRDGAAVELAFVFQVDEVPATDVFLVLEQAESFDIRLNGEAAAAEPNGWYLDKSFVKVKLPVVRPGSNELLLRCAYRQTFELEDCYLIGDFAVNAGRSIAAEPELLHVGDWCHQGYYHYCGGIVYHFACTLEPIEPGRRRVLELDDFRAVTVEVRVNGASAGLIPWKAAGKLDLTEHLRAGTNRIDIEVTGSARNLLGPLHQRGSHNPWTDWTFFTREHTRDEPQYTVLPYGLMSKANIYQI